MSDDKQAIPQWPMYGTDESTEMGDEALHAVNEALERVTGGKVAFTVLIAPCTPWDGEAITVDPSQFLALANLTGPNFMNFCLAQFQDLLRRREERRKNQIVH